ncbi:MAG: Ldh family oxidoreductase [Pseudomonadota bacterium]
MTEAPAGPVRYVALDDLSRFCEAALTAVGADAATADSATRAMMHATRLGVDSHGVRLLAHYVKALDGGRLNKGPNLVFHGHKPAAEALDADHAHGARAAYAAMERAVALAAHAGVGIVGIQNSSHFGAAGAYALRAAEMGYLGLAVCNSDSFMRLHEGAVRFHGTNPIAAAAPVPGMRPWLLDMATSAVPFNRVRLYRNLGEPVPEGAASDVSGQDTTDPDLAEMLAPLGGIFGFKGAGLAGLVEILSAVVTGMKLSPELAPMSGPDFSTPRGLGAFVLAIDPAVFVARERYDDGMQRYLDALRGSEPRADGQVMAPGDREWEVERQRRSNGAPVDPGCAADFEALAARFDLTLPWAIDGA